MWIQTGIQLSKSSNSVSTKSEKYINKSGAVGRVLIDLLEVFQWLKGSNMDADPAEF